MKKKDKDDVIILFFNKNHKRLLILKQNRMIALGRNYPQIMFKKFMCRLMDGWKGGWMNEWIDEWMDEWMDGWMGGWMDGWMDGWTDGMALAKSDALQKLNHFSFQHHFVMLRFQHRHH